MRSPRSGMSSGEKLLLSLGVGAWMQHSLLPGGGGGGVGGGQGEWDQGGCRDLYSCIWGCLCPLKVVSCA